MIQWMHALSKHWLVTLLMGGVVVAFVFFGMGLEQFNIGGGSAVATVGGTEIDQTDFQRTYKAFVKSESEKYGGALTPDMAQKLGLDRVVLQQMEIRTAIDNEASNLGLTVSDAQVAQQVRDIPAFKGVLGTFDRAVFQQRIADAGFNSEDEFLTEIRKDAARQQLTGAVESNFAVPLGYAQAIFLFINERRAADYVLVSPDNAGTVAAPSDAVLAAYVKANPDRFSTPEYRSGDYAYITVADANVTVTDAQIKAAFDVEKSKYIAAEKRDVQQILFKTEADAKAARAKIAAGASYESVGTPASLGTVEPNQIPDPATSKAVFSLALNEVSQPLSNGFGGWTLDRVTKIVPGSNKTLDDVKEDIRKELLPQVARQKLDDIANAFTDARSAGLDLVQAAKKAGMKTGHIDAVDATGLKPDGSKADIPADPEFLQGLFKAEAGEDGDPFGTKSGAYYVVKVNGVTPPKLKTLDQVRAAATESWMQEQKAKQAAQRTAQLVAQAEKEKSLDGIAKALNVSVQHSPALNRQTNDATFSPTVIERLFDAPAGGVASGPQGSSGGFIIARVTGIVHPRLNPNDRGFVGGAAQLSAQIAGDFTNALANAARVRQGVKVNQKLVAQLVGNGGQ